MRSYNINNEAIIYPTQSGWVELKHLLLKSIPNESMVTELIKRRTTEDGGYKDQLWEIMNTMGPMFFNGTQYFEHMNITLCDKTKKL